MRRRSEPRAPAGPGSREVPRVGVGCVVMRGDRVLLVRRRGAHGGGTWSTPGGHLDFGETPGACAARETKEETGVEVTNLEFLAITNDLFDEAGRHYVTIWMRGQPDDAEAVIHEPEEIAELGWFEPHALPEPLFRSLENLLSGRGLPSRPPGMPAALARLAGP